MESNTKILGKNANSSDEFNCQIDFLDIIELNKLALVNEHAVTSENAVMRETYKHNIFI